MGLSTSVSAVLILLLAGLGYSSEIIYLEAEAFEEHGGWVIDQQGMDRIGSAYLNAHGMGIPTADAVTSIDVETAGTYNVFVRTRDWVRPYGPGRFQVLVDQTVLENVVGIGGDGNWDWHLAGEIAVQAGIRKVSLRDLTGFNGRCDAILMTNDLSYQPPNDLESLTRLRIDHIGFAEEPRAVGDFDFVVVGGGFAGVCAAVSAARLGVKTALIQDRPVLGGNGSSEIKVRPEGRGSGAGPYPNIGAIVDELGKGTNSRADEKRLDVVRNEPLLSLFVNTRGIDVEMDGSRITAVIAQSTKTAERLKFTGRYFADCTGDGVIGVHAGADHRYGREAASEFGESPQHAPETADSITMGCSNYWRAMDHSGKDYFEPGFPECPWALQFNDQTVYPVTKSEWTWESGFRVMKPKHIEYVRDHNLRAIYGNWSYLKNKGYYHEYMFDYVNYVTGPRESYRLMGDIIFTENDFDSMYADACVISGWKIDLHCPDTMNSIHFPNQEFRSDYCGKARGYEYAPYEEDTLMMKRTAGAKTAAATGYLPYRSFYSRNIDNLFMAGRCASTSRVAMGSFRVMKTGGLMGEVVGRAASVCVKHSTTPRGVYTDHLEELRDLFAIAVDDEVGKKNATRYFSANPTAGVQTTMVLIGRNKSLGRRMHPNTLIYDSKGRRIGTVSDLIHNRNTFTDKILIFDHGR